MITVKCPFCTASNDVWYDDFVKPLDVRCGNCRCWFEVQRKYEVRKPEDSFPAHIFSGEFSTRMWDTINAADSIGELRSALRFVCYHIQKLEGRVNDLRIENSRNTRKLNLEKRSDSTDQEKR